MPILDFAGLAIYVALGLTALVGLFITVLLVRRVAQKRFSNAKAADEFVEECLALVERRDYAAVTELCDSPPYWSKATPQLIQTATENRHLPPARLRRTVAERFERHVLADLEYRSSWVATIVKTAPMLGLLGTVVGMIAAFAKIAAADQTGTNPSLLANDIAVALNTTASGLAIAIPMVIAGNLLQNKISKLQDGVEERLGRYLDGLIEAESGAAG
ncbi:MotA/TolQ/ExbB proton channel family protein [Alienimonas californiensis]|uniref:Biopolymer transport protein ExbB n=1 Tax=Alienimonas californiensis TaxID=2527989 RepID=A0A517PC81_9PLAN|nr:MotA/TolQ/ExbB proton channel family protein [Alienimonas californiensis]QDT16993.1 Biopolymer transport protein ExbB [Alienimonas californiensis]